MVEILDHPLQIMQHYNFNRPIDLHKTWSKARKGLRNWVGLWERVRWKTCHTKFNLLKFWPHSKEKMKELGGRGFTRRQKKELQENPSARQTPKPVSWENGRPREKEEPLPKNGRSFSFIQIWEHSGRWEHHESTCFFHPQQLFGVIIFPPQKEHKPVFQGSYEPCWYLWVVGGTLLIDTCVLKQLN